MPRALLYLIAIPVLLIVLAAILIPLFLDEEQLLALATEALEERTGISLNVNGDASLSLFPRIALELEEAELALPGEQQPDLSARRLDIGVQLMPLFSGSVEIERLALDGLLVNVPPGPSETGIDTSQMSNAELDAFYAARRQAMQEAGAEGAGAALALPMALEVAELSLTNSRIVLLADGNGDATVIDLQALHAEDLNLDGRPVPLTLSLSVPRQDEQPPLVLELATRLTLDAGASLVTLGDLEARVEGLTGDPMTLAAQGSADLERMAADLELSVDIGPTHGEGSVRYATVESPQIDARLHFNALSPALFALAGPGAAQESDDEDPSADSGDEPLPLNALRSIDTRAQLTVDSATFDAHEISDLDAQLRIVDGVVRIPRLSGKVHGGALSMNATFNAKHNEASLNTRGSLSDVDLPRLLEALESKPLLTGAATLDWELASRGRTANALRNNLSGPIGLHTRELVLQGMGVERMFCQTVALVNREKLGTELPTDSRFEALTADIQLADGKAKLAPLRAELPHITLTGRGNVVLDSLAFDADFKAKLARSLSELDPACRVNERYTAIDWPVECEGELGGEPGDWCKVDSGEIVEDLTKNEVQRKVQKEAGRLFDKLLKKDDDDTE